MHRYSRLMIVLHWTTAVLVLAAWFTAQAGPQIRANPPVLHFTLGLAVLLLMVPRLLARWIGGAPPADHPQGRWMNLAAKGGHAVLYLFLIGLPLTGWYTASRLGVPVSFLGMAVPSLAAPAPGAPGLIAEMHQTGGTLLLILAGLHALLALWHQFILRDGTLTRMTAL